MVCGAAEGKGCDAFRILSHLHLHGVLHGDRVCGPGRGVAPLVFLLAVCTQQTQKSHFVSFLRPCSMFSPPAGPAGLECPRPLGGSQLLL